MLYLRIHNGDLVPRFGLWRIISVKAGFRSSRPHSPINISFIQTRSGRKRPIPRNGRDVAANTTLGLRGGSRQFGLATGGKSGWTITSTPRWHGKGIPGTVLCAAPVILCVTFGGIHGTPTSSRRAGTCATCR